MSDLQTVVGWSRSLGPGPAYLILYVTDRCDLRCPFCFNRPGRRPRARELTANELDRLSRTTGRLFELLITGGEPFLREDLAEILLSFARNARPMVVSIPTHGGHPDRIEAVVERVLGVRKDLRLHINLSVDARDEAHDRLRGSPGLLARLLETRERLQRLRDDYGGLWIGVNTVVGDHNREDLEGLIRWVGREIRPDFHDLGLEREVVLTAPAQEVRRLYAEVRHALEAAGSLPEGLPGALHRAYCRHLDLSLPRRQPAWGCVGGRKLITILADGRVFPCEPFWLEPDAYPEFAETCMGRLDEHGFDLARLLDKPRARDIARKVAQGRCGCLWECALLTSVLFKSRGVLEVGRQVLRPGSGRPSR